jgi:ABC-type transporter Mla subunit MlaD
MAAAMIQVAKTSMVKLRLRQGARTAGLLLPLLLVGCGSSKVAQCNQLAEVVNQTQGFMKEFETEIQTFSESAAQVKNLDDIKLAASQYTTAVDKVVTNLNGLVTDLQTTTLRDDTLSQFRDDYVGVVEGFSGALTDAREAMDLVVQVQSEAELPAKIEESQQQTMTAVAAIEELSQTESQLINDVNGYCGAAQPAAQPTAQPTDSGS